MSARNSKQKRFNRPKSGPVKPRTEVVAGVGEQANSPSAIVGRNGPSVPEKQPEKPVAPVPIFDDISQWAKAYSHRISDFDVLTAQYCADNGIPFRMAEISKNPHSIAHVCRDEALRKILISEGRGKRQLNVLDWFGGGRNISFTPAFGPFGKTKVGGKYISSKVGLKINFVMSPDTAIAGDNGRTMTRCKTPLDGSLFDVVFLQDIYHHGPTPKHAFTPEAVLQLIQLCVDKRIYIINRTFFGCMGADDFGNGKEEQVFYRTSDNLIVSSPDPESAAYACHPDTDWLAMYRSFGGIDLCPLHKVGPYSLVRCSATLVGAQPLGVQILPQADFVWMDLQTASWWTRFCNWIGCGRLPKKVRIMLGMGEGKIPVHVPTLNLFSSKFAVKSPNGQILDSLISAVERSMGKNHQCKSIGARFPQQYRELFQGTIKACLHGDRKEFGDSLHDLRYFNRETEIQLAATRAASGLRTRGSWKWTAIGLAAAGFGTYKALAGAYVIPSRPVLSAVVEEAVALASETSAFVGATYEWGRNVSINPLGATATYVGHGVLYMLRNSCVGGRIASLIVHVGWNYWVSNPRVTNLFANFLRCYREGMILPVTTRGWEPLPGGLSLPSYVTKISGPPAKFRGTIEVQVDNVIVDLEKAFELLESDEYDNRTFPILITNRLLHQPANCAKNLLAAIVHRLHADPFIDNVNTEEQRHANWKKMANLFISNGLLWEFPEKTVEMEEVFFLMGKKGERIRRAYLNILDGRTTRFRKTINLKWNETLSVTKDMEGVLTMKPRAIQNLEPEVHAIMSPFARVLNFILHSCFDGRIHSFEGHAVRLVFASGSTGAQLNEIGNWLCDGVFTVVVSGDDSVVSFGDETRDGNCFGEGDQSAFDHTQDDGPNRIFQGMLQQHLGFPKEFTDIAYEACSSGYTSRKKRFFARGECGTQMPTGITTTTTYNSVATLTMWLFWLINPELSVEEAGAALGFKVKFQSSFSLSQVTFLKGWWLRTVEGPVVWYPLPSACVKLGKMINDPLAVTAFKRRGKRMYRSNEEAVAMCAHALSSSYQCIPEGYPIFGPFLGVLRRLGSASPTALKRLEESLKPISTGGTLIPQEAENAIMFRYGISLEEIIDVTRLLSQITSLPAYVEHIVFDKLASVDY
jgi:hypothetical protein